MRRRCIKRTKQQQQSECRSSYASEKQVILNRDKPAADCAPFLFPTLAFVILDLRVMTQLYIPYRHDDMFLQEHCFGSLSPPGHGRPNP